MADIIRVEKLGVYKIPLKYSNYINLRKYKYTNKNEEVIFSYHKDNEYLYLPLNLEKLKSAFEDNFEKVVIESKSSLNEINYQLSDTFNLRDYQQKVMVELLNTLVLNQRCILQAETGFGKSYCIAWLLEKLQQT